jgi:Tfp pilus assembly protein PilZ
MSLSKIKFQKYNIYITKLFNLILTLNSEEQRFLLKKIEKLILKEKRASTRKVCRIPVRYFYNERIFNNFIVNIGWNGCFIESQKPLSVGEKLLMDIQLDGDAESIRIKGEVAHASRIGMGIEFEKVSSKLLEKLGNLLYKII